MNLRLVILACTVVALAACSKNMAINIAPPECTVDEKSDCTTIRQNPNAMTEEAFFQKGKK